MRAVVLLFVLGCASDPGDAPVPVTSGAYHHYVTSALRIPLDADQQRAYGLDIDGDLHGKPDNQLGTVFIAFASNSDADLQGQIDQAIDAGTLVLLHAVRADRLAGDRTVSWQSFVGADRAPPAFDGSDTFQLANEGASEPMLGRTAGGAFEALGAGRLTLELDISESEPPIALDVIGARVEATIDAAGCTGRLGGAITQHAVDTVLLPSVVAMMNAAIRRDPGCPSACMSGTSAALIVEVFDVDRDGVITEQELRGSSLIQTLLAPDVDLLDEAGGFAADGIAESISLGVGFDCVAASFEAPGEVAQ